MTGQLLTAIQARLAGLGIFRDAVLSELVHPEGVFLPPSCRVPAAAIKDGNEAAAESLVAGGLTRRVEVLVGVIVEAKALPGQSLLEMLQLAEAVKTALAGNLLGLAFTRRAAYSGAEESTPLTQRSRDLAMKIVRFTYELEEEL